MKNRKDIYPKIKVWIRFFAVLYCCILSGQNVIGQEKMKFYKSAPISCPVGHGTGHGQFGIEAAKQKVAAYHAAKKLGFQKSSAAQNAEFIITYGDGFEDNQQAKDAFQFAADIWAAELISSVPIRVRVSFVSGTSGTANANVGYFVSDFPNAPIPGLRYPGALANSIAGEILGDVDDFEMIVRINPSTTNYYYGLDGNTPEGQIDFVTVMLHELTHALGLFSSIGDVYSSYIFNDLGIRLAQDREAFLEGRQTFLDGSNSMRGTSNGGFPRLRDIGSTDLLNTLSHLERQENPMGNINSLMLPFIPVGESNFNPGPIVKGIFADMGWQFADSNLFPLILEQFSFSKEYNQGDSDTQNTIITNITDQDLILNLGVSGSLGQAFTFNQPESVSLTSGDSLNLEAVLDTSVLIKGDYIENITIAVANSDIIYRIPVNFRLFDGTPNLEIPRDSIAITQAQNSVIEELFTISNIGDDILEYTLSIENASEEFVSISEPTGTIAREESKQVAILFDANGLDTGTYTAILRLVTNDNDSPVVEIPIEIEVIGAPIISIMPENLEFIFEDFSRASDTLNIINTGVFPLDYTIAVQDSILSGFSVDFRNPEITSEEGIENFSQEIVMRLENCNSLDNDVYNTEFIIESNDPINPGITVPVTFRLPGKRGKFELLGTDTFGDVLVGDVVTRDFIFRNIGMGSIIFDNLGPFFLNNNPQGFSVINWSTDTNDTNVSPGDSFSVTIQFAPTTQGAKSRNMITRGSENVAANCIGDFPILGNAVITPIIETSTDSISSAIEISGSNMSTSETFIISNTGNAELNYRLDLEESNNYISFSDPEGMISAGDSKEITVVFDASSLDSGRFDSQFTVTSTVASTSSLLESVTVSTNFEVIRPEIGDFGNTPSFWNFGTASLGIESSVELSLDNVGNAPITLSSMQSSNAEFEIIFYDQETFEEVTFEEVSKVIQPGDVWFYDVRYLRTQVGEANGTITVESDALQSVFEIGLSGNGEAIPIGEFPESSTVINFAPIISGNVTSREATVRNIGTAPITLNSVALDNPEFEILFFDKETFEEIPFEEANKVIAPGEFLAFKITYRPTQIGAATGTITIISDAFQNEYTIDVSGSATEPIIGGVLEDVFYNVDGVGFEQGTEIDFGINELGVVSTVDIFPINSGDTGITISAIDYQGDTGLEVLYYNEDFELVDSFEDFVEIVYPFVFQSAFRLIYSRTTPGDFSGTILIRSNATQEVLTLNINGGAIPPPAEITSFALVRPFTGEIIQEIEDGDTIDLAGFPGASIVANVGDTKPGSVVFDYDETNNLRTENDAPYAISGAVNGRIFPFNISLGMHTLTATPYSEPDGNGEAQIAKTISFTAINSDLASISDFVLINADTDEEIGIIKNGDTIDVSAYKNNAFNVVARPLDASVRFVQFGFNGDENFGFDTSAPFSLAGDFRGDYRALAFTNGTQTLTATPFAFRSGNPATITFEVIGAEEANKTPGSVSTETFKVYPNPVDGMAKFTLGTTKAETLQGRLVNILGQELDITNRLSIDTQGNGQLDMQNIPAGHYYLKLSDLETGVSYETKIIKM